MKVDKGTLLERTSLIVLIAASVTFCLGLYLFQLPRRIEIVTLASSRSYDVRIGPLGNCSYRVSPFEKTELVEYFAANLTDFLANRTVSIKLQTANNETLSLVVVNSTQDETPNSARRSQAELILQEVSAIEISFSPRRAWGTLTLVLFNKRDAAMRTELHITQLFLLRAPQYDQAFLWLTAAFVSAATVFALTYRMNLTLDDIPDKALHFLLPEDTRFKQYIPLRQGLRPISGTFGVMCAVIVILTLVNIFRIVAIFTFAKEIFRDFYYRRAVMGLVLCLLFFANMTGVRFVYGLLFYPLCPRHFPDPSLKRSRDRLYDTSLRSYLTHRYSVATYVFSAIYFLLLVSCQVNLESIFVLVLPPILIFLAYISSRSYAETWKRVSTSAARDLRLVRAAIGLSFLVSLLWVYSFQTMIPVMQTVARNLIDEDVLSAHNRSQPWNLTSEGLAGFLSQTVPLVAYVIPIAATIFYYLFAVFSTISLPKEAIKNARREVAVDLLFFGLVYFCGLWLQSLYAEIGLRQAVLSVASSFIAASFRNYLYAWTHTGSE